MLITPDPFDQEDEIDPELESLFTPQVLLQLQQDTAAVYQGWFLTCWGFPHRLAAEQATKLSPLADNVSRQLHRLSDASVFSKPSKSTTFTDGYLKELYPPERVEFMDAAADLATTSEAFSGKEARQKAEQRFDAAMRNSATSRARKLVELCDKYPPPVRVVEGWRQADEERGIQAEYVCITDRDDLAMTHPYIWDSLGPPFQVEGQWRAAYAHGRSIPISDEEREELNKRHQIVTKQWLQQMGLTEADGFVLGTRYETSSSSEDASRKAFIDGCNDYGDTKELEQCIGIEESGCFNEQQLKDLAEYLQEDDGEAE